MDRKLELAQAILDCLPSAVAIVEVENSRIVVANKSFSRLIKGESPLQGKRLSHVLTITGSLLESLCAEAVLSDRHISTCFSWKPPCVQKPSFWTAEVSRLSAMEGIGDDARECAVIVLQEITEHASLVRRLDSLASLPADYVGSTDPDQVVEKTLTRCAGILGAQNLTLMLISNDPSELHLAAEHGAGISMPAEIRLHNWPSLEEVISSMRSSHTRRVYASGHEREFMDRAKVASLLACPLISMGESIGVLIALFTNETACPTHDDICLTEIAAEKCVIAIERDRASRENARVLAAEHAAHARALEYSRQLTALLESLSDGVMIIDGQGGVKLINAVALRHLGRTSGSILSIGQALSSMTIYKLDGSRIDADSAAAIAFLKGQGTEAVDIILESDSGRRYIKATSGAVFDDDGKLNSIIIVAHDWSDFHQMKQAQQDVIRIVSHDLRTPLTQIMARAQLVEIVADKPDAVRKGASAVVRASIRMNKMISDITDSARIDLRRVIVNPIPIDLTRIIPDIIEGVLAEEVISRVQVRCGPDFPLVMADPVRLERIVSNIVTNALKYSRADSPVFVDVKADGNMAVISVTDRGEGISPEELPYVFERYYRSSRVSGSVDGLGIGLYICRAFVQAMGGKMWAESTLGQGSVFSFTLPLATGSGDMALANASGLEPQSDGHV